MWYHASDIIASDHPELSDQIQSIDSFLHELQGELFRLYPTADILKIKPEILQRLINLYESQKAVNSVTVKICPKDDAILSTGEDGVFECDLCDTIYQQDECETEIAFQPKQLSPAINQQNAPLFAHGFALLIGIGSYQKLNHLSKTIPDASDLHALLTDPHRAGYPSANVALLLDEQATKSAISDRLDWLARQVHLEDTAIVFFSGHGAQRVGGFEPGEYLCPVEADWYNLRTSCISTQELTTALNALQAGRVVCFLDACHSGGVGEIKDASLQIKAGLSEEFYTLLSKGKGRVIISSCYPDEVSWELPDMRNGLFTNYLLEALRGAARNKDGSVRIMDLFSYVSENIPKHKPQHPLFKGEVDTNFPIAFAP